MMAAARQRSPVANAARPSGLLQRACTSCGQHGHGTCHACGSGKSEPASDPAQLVNQTLQGPGQAIDRETRAFMEPRLGHDFSGVRVHTDTGAAASAAAMHANAYTVGQDIVFASGRYAPGSQMGRRLIAHELSHVVQQDNGGTPAAMFDRAVSHPSDATEREAVAAADTVAGGGSYHPALAADAALQGDASGGGIGGFLNTVTGTSGAGLAALAGALARFSITQTNTDGTPYSSDVNITFTPTSSRHCDEIAFVQAVKHVDATSHANLNPLGNYKNRMTAANWTVDRVQPRQYGWYGYNNDGKPSGSVSPGKAPTPLTPATLHDTPRNDVSNCDMSFETCAICRTGTDANQVYGCLQWGFGVDAANKLTSHKPAETAAPSAEFTETIKQWNVQAKGPAAQRNDPNQQLLGPFK
jgi:hypothetical protein